MRVQWRNGVAAPSIELVFQWQNRKWGWEAYLIRLFLIMRSSHPAAQTVAYPRAIIA